MSKVRAKKKLGQHFLINTDIAERIVHSLSFEGYRKVVEIGPGMGVLSDYLMQKNEIEFSMIELDIESVGFLKAKYPQKSSSILHADFLKIDLQSIANNSLAVIGNFPYNISSQIVFKILENKEIVPEMVGMFQKEVAERICSKPGSREYGILSVLTQAFYETEYLFTVEAHEFDPPPKVLSGVMRMRRKGDLKLACPEKDFKRIVKLAFNQRRKTLRNSLKSVIPQGTDLPDLFQKRPEQLAYTEFVYIVNFLSGNREAEQN